MRLCEYEEDFSHLYEKRDASDYDVSEPSPEYLRMLHLHSDCRDPEHPGCTKCEETPEEDEDDTR